MEEVGFTRSADDARRPIPGYLGIRVEEVGFARSAVDIRGPTRLTLGTVTVKIALSSQGNND